MILRFSRSSLLLALLSTAALPLAGCNGCGEDADEDGWTVEEGDCNDEDAAVFPTSIETACDGIDQDCTGEDLVPDEDGDGATACPSDPEDCNDDDATVFPGADEQCDEVDHDCDGENFNGLTQTPWYPDADEDGYGDATAEQLSCETEAPDGFVGNGDDCDDDDDAINPDATELCDEVDHDCDGDQTNGLETFVWYVDGDEDGYGALPGDANPGVEACDGLQPEGSTQDSSDCEDTIFEVNPGVAEICNLRDDNCDSAIDEGFDVDNDGVTTCGADGDPATLEDNDCDDNDAANSPLLSEGCDAQDNDCDGLVDDADDSFVGADQDADGDNSASCPTSPGTDCDDFNPALNGLDVDGDGESSCAGDCNDEHLGYNTTAAEYCEGEDTDCDGLSDDVDPDVSSDGDQDGVDGVICGGDDCDDSDAHIYPIVEYTSGLQKDCEPAIRPGIQNDWHVGRVELPFLFEDNGDCYLYFRGNGDQNQQALGVVEDVGCTGTFSEPNDNPNNPILEIPTLASWDDQGISNPTVVFVPTFARPYLLYYHGKDGANRKVGLATATDPMGPFQRLDPTGASLNAPVIDLGLQGLDLDSRQVHHPVTFFDGTTIHMWYTGRSTDFSPDFHNVYATSADGVVWTKFDNVLTPEAPEPVVSPGVPGNFDEDRVYSPGVLQETFDPDGGYDFEHWYTGRSGGNIHAVGVAHGSTSNTTKCDMSPILETEDSPRLDSFLVSGQGLYYEPQGVASGPDFGVLSVHYGAVAELDPACCPNPNGQNPGNCSTYPWDENYLNLTCKAAYVATATNNVPIIAVTNLADNDTVTSPFTLTGTVDDNAPDLTMVEVQFVGPGVGDGLSGTPTLATVASTGNQSTTVQQTTWTAATSPSAGNYDVLVTVEDEGCARRTLRIADVTVQ